MIFRRFGPEDKQAVMSVLVASFGGWHGDKNEPYWTWKSERNPHGKARIYVGDDGGHIAGCYILMPMMLRVGDATLSGVQAVDAAVSRDYAGRGVFTGLAETALKEAVEDGIDMIFAFPSKGAFGGQVRVGFTPTLAIPKTCRTLLRPARRKHGDDLAVREVHAVDRRFDMFSAHGVDGEVRVRRDFQFLDWRYGQHPTKTYTTLVCEHAGEICGYAVLSVDGAGPASRGYILDLQVLPEHRSAAGLLVNQCIGRLRSLGARFAVCWERPSGSEQEALRSTGFSRRYLSIQRRLTHSDYVDQLIVFDSRQRWSTNGPPASGDRDAVTWSLVPGDADYT